MEMSKSYTRDFIIVANEQDNMRFSAPRLNLLVRFNEKNDLFGIDAMTTFTDADTGEMIISVSPDFTKNYTWEQCKRRMTNISRHAPLYRVVKALFDGKLYATKDPDDEYDVDYVDYLPGYEIM